MTRLLLAAVVIAAFITGILVDRAFAAPHITGQRAGEGVMACEPND